MNEVITQNTAPVPHNPFQRMQASHISAGSVAIESERAIAEAQAKMVIAKRFPRDEAGSFAKAMEACQRPSLAAAAFYSYPRGNETVSGPTIRLAEELARCWGNIEYGIRELSRKDGVSEMQAFAIDLEANNHSVQNFTVRHIRDKRGGGKELTDERDIYELTANMGGRRLRARILAILPPDLKDAAVARCRQTIAIGAEGGKVEPSLADRVKRMVVAFAKIGVADELLVKRLGHKLDTTNPDEFADLHGIYTSLKDGVTKIADWFGDGEQDGDEQKAGINSVVQKEAAKAKTEKKPATEPEKEPAAEPAKEPAEKKPESEKTQAASAKTESANSKNTQKKGSPVKDPDAPAPVASDASTQAQPDDDGPVF